MTRGSGCRRNRTISPALRGLTLFLIGPVLLSCGVESAPNGAVRIPEPDLTQMETQVERRFRETRARIESEPDSAAAWGRFGMVAHAHELWAVAATSYRQAERLDPEDERWPYFLGDVLTTVGTDLEAAAAAFRRMMALRPDHAPAHLRLGRVLHATGEMDAAALELEHALEIEPGLQPARVTLAQIRLAEGQLETAAGLLEQILEAEPRHGQALSALGQVYMRQGRRTEARKIAERARDAALYNLYSDSLMAPVVAEGVSTVLLWERAKAFFDVGDYTQAALGLQQVVELQPTNVDAHEQLAVAYGNLGDLERSRQHLQRVVALVPDRVDSRFRLAAVHLDQGAPAAAIPHLERVLELAPSDRDAFWLLGRAQLLAGDAESALSTFEKAEATGGGTPVWAHNEWGSALAQSGRVEAALARFRAALEADEDNAQALFFIGLIFEGQGRIGEAVKQYCASIRAQPNPPANLRLKTLGRVCA